MDIEMERAAKDGDIDALYELIKREPFVLEAFDKIPFVKTPLHVAAAAGHTLFACEIMRLKPSFSRKLDLDGLSPLHLALQSGFTKTAKRLVEVDPQLIRVQGREGFTPLLYLVAELEDSDANLSILSEFLLAKPSSMKDLTIGGESALHLAVKKKKVEALKVLLGWLKWTGKESMLDWKDMDGNTVLHIAVDTNQTQVLKTVITRVNKDSKNLNGLTPLDIVLSASQTNDEAKKILRGAYKATSLPTLELSDFLRSSPSRLEVIFSNLYYLEGISLNMQSALLVVAALVMTITYQGIITPPAGLIPSENDNTAMLVNLTVTNIITRAKNVTTTMVANSHMANNSLGFEHEPYSQSRAELTAETKLMLLVLYGLFNALLFSLSLCLIAMISSGILPGVWFFFPIEFLCCNYIIADFSVLPTRPIWAIQLIVVLLLYLRPITQLLYRRLENRKSTLYLRRKILYKLVVACARDS